jgi:hypothetical protein
MFINNTRCTYVIKKSIQFAGLAVEIKENSGGNVTYFIGGKTFESLKTGAQVVSTKLTPTYTFSQFSNTNYMWLQLTSLNDLAEVSFTVQGILPLYDTVPTPPASPSPSTPSNTTTPEVSSGSSGTNVGLIIGIVVGVLGFIGIVGFLIYYVKKQKAKND